MNQPAKSKATSPSTETADSAGSDWGLDVPKKKGLSETRIGLLLVVCLVGALGYLTFRKLEERRHNPRGSDFHEPATVADSDGGVENSRPGEQHDVNPGHEAGWATGPGDGPGFVHDPGSQTTTDVNAAFLSSPPMQQEPDESAPRTFADDRSTGLLDERTTPESQPHSEPQPVADDTSWNPFSAETPLEAPQPDNASVPHEVGIAGTADTASNSRLDASPDTEQGWMDNPRSEPAVTRDSSTADEIITTGETGNPFFVDESEERHGSVFGGDPPPGDESAPVADVSAESSERASPEPLLVPAEDAQVIPVASDGTAGDFTRQAAVETAGNDPWASPAPRELAQHGNPSAIELNSGDTPSTSGSDAATNSASDADFLPDSRQPTTSGGAWNSGPAGTTPSTSTGSDPFFQTSVHGGMTSTASEQVTVHTVQTGENFWTIAHRYYQAGRYANALAAFNQSRIPDPRKMRPGMKVLVPDRQILAQRFPKLTGVAYGPGPAADAARPGFFVDRGGQPAYRVGKSDTLTGIAARHLGRSSRWVQVLGMNRDQLKDANSLKIGMVLKLPLDATQVSVVTETAIAR